MCDSLSAIIDSGKLNKYWDQIIQLPVLHIIIPRDYGNGLFWLKHVCRWWIVQNNGILGISSDLWHVFGEHSIHICAVLSEQSHRTVFILIHLIHEWISIFGKTCSKNNQFIVLCHHFQKIVDSWSLLNINLTDISLKIEWRLIR